MEADDQSVATDEDGSDEDGKDDHTLGEPAGDGEGPAADGEMSEPGSAATDEEPVAMDEDAPAPAADGSQGSSGAPASPVPAGRRAYVVGKVSPESGVRASKLGLAEAGVCGSCCLSGVRGSLQWMW
jgi:hypothetical protein